MRLTCPSATADSAGLTVQGVNSSRKARQPMNPTMPTTPHPEQPNDARRGGPTDAGFTLSEVVVAIGLTGVLILTIIAAGWTLIRVSRVSDDQAAVEAVLGAAADELTQFGWQSCPEETLAYEARVGESASRIEWPAVRGLDRPDRVLGHHHQVLVVDEPIRQHRHGPVRPRSHDSGRIAHATGHRACGSPWRHAGARAPSRRRRNPIPR